VLGGILGLTQTVRGAHYPSHTLWTGLICWAVAVLNHWLFDTFAHRRQALASS
jgi:membrane-associated PAP2 superfamily phosphatase